MEWINPKEKYTEDRAWRTSGPAGVSWKAAAGISPERPNDWSAKSADWKHDSDRAVLSRADMANWSIRCEEWLLPIYNRIHEQLLECQVLHMDEIRIQCNKEDVKKASSESFMWVMRSAECEEVTAAYFYYSRSRSG